ncbi:phosphonate C-P lyase system protein PhnH [Sporolactobacillus sp. KGMB 08714]|uniref:phosphonate C-P lyase system protein PhnH n=1 Tax=Sporolactobacillus sp. KGMB 08714 TaxID=3064704 RepID=UPI002FBE3DCD
MINANLPEFDEVRDTQIVFRQLLDCMARPGKINSVSPFLRKIGTQLPCSPRMFMIASILLDYEVGFHLISAGKIDAFHFIEWRTRSRHVAINQADYLLVDAAVDARAIDEIMDTVRTGTLQSPERSATLILGVDGLSDRAGLPLALTLKGPGIKEKRRLFIAGMDKEWLEKRKQVNKEYPTGCDFILMTAAGEMAALPRTTFIESEGL